MLTLHVAFALDDIRKVTLRGMANIPLFWIMVVSVAGLLSLRF